MKRVAVIAIFMAVMASLFAFPVFGTTYNPTTYNSFSDSITVSNVTYSLRVTQFKALSTGTSMLPSGMETIMFVVFQLTNDNDQDALCQVPQFSIDLSDQRVITDVYTYAGDLALGITSNGFIVLPTEPYSYDASNKIVVPANSTLTLVGGIGLPAQLNQTGDSTLDTGLRNVHLLYKPYTVTLGTYSHGTPIDITPIVQYIDGIESSLSNIDNAIDDIGIDVAGIVNTINNIYSSIVYTGPDYSFNSINGAYYQTDFTNSNVRTIARIRTGASVLGSIDTTVNAANDTTNVNGMVRVPINIFVLIQNRNNKAVQAFYVNYIKKFINYSGTLGLHIDLFLSNMYSTYYYYTDGRFEFTDMRHSIPSNPSLRYIPTGNSYLILNGYIEYDESKSFSYVDASTYNFDNFWNNTTFSLIDGYYPSDEFTILRDLYTAYSQVNGLDDIDDVTDDITSKSESAHTQEQSYFTQNAQAIQQTGLSNYRFNGDQENGIGSVSHDFTLLWNALGGFNSVYIFSLTLSLALMILRHAPGAIRSSRRNKEE